MGNILFLKKSQQNNELIREFMDTYGYNVNCVQTFSRVKQAIDFYLDHGFSKLDKTGLFNQINGIDFNQDLFVISLTEGTELDQMQDASYGAGEIRQGQYYSFHSRCSCHSITSATERGIADCTLKSDDKFPGHEHDEFVYAADKQITKFMVVEPINVLISFAKPVADNWSMWLSGKSVSVETKGNGIQVYVGSDGNAKIKSEHEIRYNKILQELDSGVMSLYDLNIQEREVIIKQIYILYQKAQFASDKGIEALYQSTIENLEKIIALFLRISDAEKEINDYLCFKTGLSISSINEIALHALEQNSAGGLKFSV